MGPFFFGGGYQFEDAQMLLVIFKGFPRKYLCMKCGLVSYFMTSENDLELVELWRMALTELCFPSFGKAIA